MQYNATYYQLHEAFQLYIYIYICNILFNSGFLFFIQKLLFVNLYQFNPNFIHFLF